MDKVFTTKTGKRLKVFYDEYFSITDALDYSPGSSGLGEVKILAYHTKYTLGHNQIQDSELENMDLQDVLEDVTGINIGDSEVYDRVKQHVMDTVPNDHLEECLQMLEDGDYDVDEDVLTGIIFSVAKEKKIVMMQQLYLHDHGRITLRTSYPNQLGFAGGWDTSTVGYVITDLTKVKKFLPEGEELLAFAEKYADSYIELLNEVCQGEVFFIQLESLALCTCCGNETSTETLDAVSGIIGREHLKASIADLELTEEEISEIQAKL